ncbi:hypothetical protein Tco_1245977 [Tanacetum coccineum]
MVLNPYWELGTCSKLNKSDLSFYAWTSISKFQVTHVEYSDGEGDEYTSTFDAYDIFTGEKHTHEYRAKDMCKCPFVHDSMYRIISISPEGRVRLQTHDGKPRIPLTLPSNLPHPHEPDSKVILDTDFRDSRKLGSALLLDFDFKLTI